jgi:hypothetical protein
MENADSFGSFHRPAAVEFSQEGNRQWEENNQRLCRHRNYGESFSAASTTFSVSSIGFAV